jgi:hypothetical protein
VDIKSTYWQQLGTAVATAAIKHVPMSETMPNQSRTGRPRKRKEERSIPVRITLTPQALAKVDALGSNRSAEIERLIMESTSIPFAG